MNLSEHVITEVAAGEVRNCWPRLIGKNARLSEHGYGYGNRVTIIKTDTGFIGWGAGHADRTLKISLEGRKVSDVFAPDKGILNSGYCEADIALHDLAGNILGISVSKMINTDSKMQTKCYDGAVYMNDISQGNGVGIERVVNDCKNDALAGYADFKIKVGRGGIWMEKEAGLKRDAEIVCAVQKEFPNAKILVDFNDGADVETVKKFMDMVRGCNIYWIEEPFRENYEDCMRLKDYLSKVSPNTLIADGEFEYREEEIVSLAEKGAVDVLLMDIVSYGFTAWRKLIKKCMKTGIKCSPHCWGVGIKTNVSAHLAAAFPSVCPTIEGVPDISEGVDYSGYKVENGILSVEERPGFGMQLEYAKPVEIFKPY